MKFAPLRFWACCIVIVAACLQASAQQKLDPGAILLKDMVTRYEDRKAELRKPLDDLAKRYREVLEGVKDRLVKSGELEGVLAAKEALNAFAAGDAATPSKNAEVERMRGIYVNQQKLLCKQMVPQVQKLALDHLEGLKAMVMALTRRENLEEAKVVAKQSEALQSLLGDLSGTQPLGEESVKALLKPGLATHTRLAGWGQNDKEQASPPKDLTDVIAIAAGLEHNLALKADGTVVAWGANAFGEGTVPPGLKDVTAIAVGEQHSLALKTDGSLTVWGQNTEGQCNIPQNLGKVIAISSQTWTNLALTAEGTVVTWGHPLDNPPANLSNITAIAMGGPFAIALKSDGTVVAWGDNKKGETNVPPGLKNVTAIAAGHFHGLALKKDGTVAAWGFNSQGQCNVPADLSNVVAIAANGWYSLALKSDGSVVAWGSKFAGQTQVPAELTKVKQLAAGTNHAIALMEDVPRATPAAAAPVAAVATTKPPLGSAPALRTLTVKIRVDGDDIVKVQQGRLWIEHHSWKKPIGIAVNGAKWEPVWNGKNSEPLVLDPPLAPFPDTGVRVHQIIGRGKTTLEEQPSAANGKTLTFHVEDDGGGADNYEVHVTW